jgi:hypothetical protein
MTPKEKQRELIVEIMKADEQSGIYDEPIMKQTAVDYLFKELWDTPKDKLTWNNILKKAKEYEKQQIKRDFAKGYITDFNNDHVGKKLEKYYKETYRSNES